MDIIILDNNYNLYLRKNRDFSLDSFLVTDHDDNIKAK